MSTAPAPVRSPEPMRHRLLAWPSTRTGKRAGWLGLGVIGLFLLDGLLAGAGASDWGWGARLALGLSGAVGLLGAIVALGLALRALKLGDRSVVLLWPLLLGALALVFVVGEFAFPH